MWFVFFLSRSSTTNFSTAQSLGKVPTVNVEKTDVAQIFLSNDSLNAEIITAKSSSVNVNVPDVVNGFVSVCIVIDFLLHFLIVPFRCTHPQVEHAIPEQFKSTWSGKGFRTEPTDLAGWSRWLNFVVRKMHIFSYMYTEIGAFSRWPPFFSLISSSPFSSSLFLFFSFPLLPCRRSMNSSSLQRDFFFYRSKPIFLLLPPLLERSTWNGWLSVGRPFVDLLSVWF